MKTFRLPVFREIEPQAFLEIAAGKLDELQREVPDGKETWTHDARTPRFLSMSCEVKPSGLGRLVRKLEKHAPRFGGMFNVAMGAPTTGVARTPIPAPHRVQQLSIQTYARDGGAELRIQGTGRAASRLAKRLAAYLEALSDADLRRLARNAELDEE